MSALREIYIFAPHVDDEVIGCWSVFAPGEDDLEKRITVVYPNLLWEGKERLEEARNAAAELGFEIHDTPCVKGTDLYEIVDTAVVEAMNGDESDAGVVCLAPDPHWEKHPFHKFVGTAVHASCLTRRCRFGTYSTNMDVPYLRTLGEGEALPKKAMLDKLYPSQKSLWEHDHRYWLFEGIAEWAPKL